jgi:D-threo-aldose 1-dehydrogenase
MEYRRLGRTGLKISEFVFGAGAVGGLLIDQDDETKRTAIRSALDAGVNWIDTAPRYGSGKSEEALGWLLKEIDDDPYVSTKVRINTSRLGDIAGQVERSVHESLTRLKRDTVHLIQLHNSIEHAAGERAMTVEQVLGRGGAIEALERVRDQGLTSHIGITALGDADPLKQVIASDRIDTAQVYYNLLNPSAGKNMPPAWQGHDFGNLIAVCKEHDVGVLNIRVLAAGIIATDTRHGRESPLTHTDISNEERRASAVLKGLGDGLGERAQMALRFVLSHPEISGAIYGMAELEHLKIGLAGQAMGPLPADALGRLDAVYANNHGL